MGATRLEETVKGLIALLIAFGVGAVLIAIGCPPAVGGIAALGIYNWLWKRFYYK